MRKKCILLALLLSMVLYSKSASAEPLKEFIMACTYGVLAGTLVGAATLAFTKKPGENLGNIARGASLGLYAGIALGVYVVYVVPNQGNEDEELNQVKLQLIPEPRYTLTPLFAENRTLDGAMLSYRVFEF